jgi:glutathione S-transferase
MSDSVDILYGYECSYYAGKIRAYLRFKGIPFVEKFPDREIFAKEIIGKVGFPVIPVIVLPDGTVLQDTSDMIDYYESRFPERSVIPSSAPEKVVSYWLELIGDEWLKIPALHYRWTYDYDFITAEMGRNNDPDYSLTDQKRVGEKIGAVFHGWLPKLGITTRTQQSIELEFLEFLSLFEDHLEAVPYLLGDNPSLGDFAFYGPLYAHLCRDPYSRRLMEECAPKVVAWVERLRLYNDPPRKFYDRKDSIRPTFIALVAHLSKDSVPTLVHEVTLLQEWLESNLGSSIPRYFGECNFKVGRGTEHLVGEKRALMTYPQWMLQRVLDAHNSSSQGDKELTLELFRKIGAKPLLALDIRWRLARKNFQLVRENS